MRRKEKLNHQVCLIVECRKRVRHRDRHLRCHHLPWFARDCRPLKNRPKLWIRLLDLVSGFLSLGGPDQLLQYVTRQGLHPSRDNNQMNTRDCELAMQVNTELQVQTKKPTDRPPNCVGALVSGPLWAILLTHLTREQRENVYAFDQQHACGHPTSSSDEMSESPTSDQTTSLRGRSETETSTRPVASPRGRPETETSTRLVASPRGRPMLRMCDTHFHYDRMMRDGAIGLTWDDQPQSALDCVDHGDATIVHAVTSFCDPKHYPSPKQLTRLATEDRILISVGHHPKKVDQTGHFNIWQHLISADCVVAVGEIGLDYSGGNHNPKSTQKKWLKTLLDEYNQQALIKPIVLHLRSSNKDPDDAYDDFLQVLGDTPVSKRSLLHFHSFTGSETFIREITRRRYRFLIGVGALAVKEHLRTTTERVIRKYIDYVVVESDAPVLSPTSGANYPESVFDVANHLAAEWGQSLFQTVDRTTDNFRAAYSIGAPLS